MPVYSWVKLERLAGERNNVSAVNELWPQRRAAPPVQALQKCSLCNLTAEVRFMTHMYHVFSQPLTFCLDGHQLVIISWYAQGTKLKD